MPIAFTGRLQFADPELTVDIRDIEIATLSSGTFLYATNGANGGVTAYALSAGGAVASVLDTAYFTSPQEASVTGVLHCVELNGQMHLTFAGNYSTTLTSYILGSNGQLGAVTDIVTLPNAPQQIAGITSLDLGGETAIYLTDVATGALMGYVTDQATGNAQAVSIPQQAPSEEDSRPTLIETVELNGVSFLLTADQGTQGITSYRISDASGNLSAADEVSATTGLAINIPTALETVSAFGQTWIIVGAAGSSSLSVMRLTDTGALEPVEHLVDSLLTRFGGIQSVSITQSGDHVFVITGGADDGLSLFTLLPDGRLVLLQTIEHNTGLGLENVGAIRTVLIGDQIQIFVTSDSLGGISQFSLSLTNLGDVMSGQGDGVERLRGGSGEDMLISGDEADTLEGAGGDDVLVAGMAGTVMTGGNGADTFVLRYGAHTQTITDFQPGQDRIDLSDLPLLRNPEQLSLTQTATGAVLRYLDMTIRITAATGQPLEITDIFGPAFEWPDRFITLDSRIGWEINAEPEGGFVRGGAGNDTANGGAGADNIWTQGGNDLIYGGANSDTLGGGDGQDTLYGGDDFDILFGGAGEDTLYGQLGDDQLWGGTEDDLIIGGFGDDSIGGSLDNDTLYGEGGNDLIFGDIGQDTVMGGNGDDVLWAGPDDDLNRGGNGNDTLGGGTGADTLIGEAGADLIYGGTGHDRMEGWSGNDTLYAGQGDDRLHGGGDDDTLSGGQGDDHLTGGTGADVFSFGFNQGNDTIADFTPDDDLIWIWAVNTDFSDLSIATNADGHAVIDMGSGVLVLEGLQPADLSADDFVFL